MPYDKELIAHKLIRWEHYLNNYKLPAWKELPDIGLYMDQVIALLGQYLDFIPMEDSKDKPVTPTTINNYVRLKVMPAPEKRKYYRVHIAFLIMIFTLKQGISINGLQQLLPSTADEEEIKNFYTSYVERLQEVGNFYTAQTRAAVPGYPGPPGDRRGGGGERHHPEHSPVGVLPDHGGKAPPPPGRRPGAGAGIGENQRRTGPPPPGTAAGKGGVSHAL